MKFTNVIISFLFYAFFSIESVQALKGLSRMEQKRDFFKNEALCTRFLSQSFKNTCMNCGFKNLSEWKKCCRVLWKLDYIDFREGEEFLCGVWTYDCRRYEVYFRKNKVE